MYKQVLDPVGDSLFLSAIFAALPLIGLTTALFLPREAVAVSRPAKAG